MLIFLISTAAMGGWFYGISVLVNIRAEWPAMAPLVAVGFFLSAAASLGRSVASEKYPVWIQRGTFAAGVLLVLGGAYIFGRHFFAWSFDPNAWTFGKNPHFMDPEVAPATALCFLLTGLWLLTDLFRPSWSFLKFLLSLFVILTCALILVSYVYGASSLYQLPLFVKMSVLTAAQFVILHFGLSYPETPEALRPPSLLRFLRDKSTAGERPLFITLLIVFSVFLGASIFASHSLNRLVQTISLVSETQTRVDELDQLLLSLLNAESGQRGYLLTGEYDCLTPYFEGAEEHARVLARLREWVQGHPEYQEAVNEIDRNSEVKFRTLANNIILFRTKGFEAAKKAVQTDLGIETMKKIRQSIAFIKNDQVALLRQQKGENQTEVHKTVASLTIGSFLAALLLFASMNLYVKTSLRRGEVEEKVRHLNHRLEKKIHEVEVVNKELESFSYSVSHDLRTPLRAMAGFSNILLEDHLQSLNEEGQKHLKRIIAASERMSRLINGILDLSRISRHEVQRERVSLSQLARQQLDELCHMDPERVVDLTVEPELEVQGDAMLLAVFLQNLLGNAWKFTSKKERAKIEFGSFLRHGQRIFFVRDNGAGFDMAYSEKLFGTFQRLHTEQEFAGTGVGLATARRIVRLHGGDIWAESKVNEGATFYFTLS